MTHRELEMERSWQRTDRSVMYLCVTLCVPPPPASPCFEALPPFFLLLLFLLLAHASGVRILCLCHCVTCLWARAPIYSSKKQQRSAMVWRGGPPGFSLGFRLWRGGLASPGHTQEQAKAEHAQVNAQNARAVRQV